MLKFNVMISDKHRQLISQKCAYYKILRYTINDDGSIDVDQDVMLMGKKLSRIPLRFNKINGKFSIRNNKILSLEGAPNEVTKNFDCSMNKLNTLKHSPRIVGGDYNCSHNKLITLRYCPEKINGDFLCGYNLLDSLKHSPLKIIGSFICNDNKISTLDGFPLLEMNAGNHYEFYNNKFPKLVEEYLNRFDDHLKIILKYYSYYEVWSPKFNEESFKGLLADIKDGLE